MRGMETGQLEQSKAKGTRVETIKRRAAAAGMEAEGWEEMTCLRGSRTRGQCRGT